MKSVLRLGISLLLGCLLPLSLLVSPASAASPKAAVKGDRVVVKFTGKQPSMAVMKAAGSSTGSNGPVRSGGPRPCRLRNLRRLRGPAPRSSPATKAKKRTFGDRESNESHHPRKLRAPALPRPALPLTQPLFAAPGVDRIGSEAWDAIKGTSQIPLSPTASRAGQLPGGDAIRFLRRRHPMVLPAHACVWLGHPFPSERSSRSSAPSKGRRGMGCVPDELLR